MSRMPWKDILWQEVCWGRMLGSENEGAGLSSFSTPEGALEQLT